VTQTTASARSANPGIVDCDVHPMLPKGKPLMDYVPADWKLALEHVDMSYTKLDGPRFNKPHSTNRVDATPPDGGPAGSDPQFMIQHMMDPRNVMYATLLPYQAGGLSAWANAEEAAIWASAFNRYFSDHWLFDPRFKQAMVVSPHDPIAAAEEIRRHGATPGVVAVWIPLINMLLGKRYFHPIYEAASEFGLPIMIHGTGGSFQGSPQKAGGLPSTFAEIYGSIGLGGLAIATLSSLIFEGTFEKFPNLKVIFVEMGWAWVGPAMWKMDRSWQSFRVQVPWCKKPPSEYVRDHVRFTTQPMDEPNERDYLLQIAKMMHADRTLLLSSDYPHWDGDDPKLSFAGFPQDLKDRIFRENALDTFGPSLLPRPVVAVPA
jgi:predicted TIM-barrel fold metal-dependent hydrolase